MQKLEMFFHAGDYDKQANFIVFPESLDFSDENEIFYEVEKKLSKYKNEGCRLNSNIIQSLKQKNTYPDPIHYKENSPLYYSQLRNGAIVFRFNIDGSVEGQSNRFDPSFEGAYLPNVNIENSIKKYGSKILKEIETAIPTDFEKILVSENFPLFNDIYQECVKNNDYSNLYRRFFVACGMRKKLIINKNIDIDLSNNNIIDSLIYKLHKKH